MLRKIFNACPLGLTFRPEMNAFTGHATFDDTTTMFEDISDLVSINAPRETPVLDRIGDSDLPADRETHQWREDSFISSVDQINEGGTLNATDLTFTVASGAKFYKGAIIEIDTEQMIVTSVSGNDITVAARGHGDTAGATHPDTTKVYIRGNAALEGDDPPASKHSTMAAKTNYTQIFAPPPVEVSGTRMAIGTIGGGDRIDTELEKRLIDEMYRLQWSFLHGTKQTSNPAGNATTPRTMQGVKWWLSSNVFDMQAANITKGTLENILRQAWDNGARRMDIILCGSWNKLILSNTILPIKRMENQDTQIQTIVERVKTDFFDGEIMLVPGFPPNEILVLTSANLKCLPLKGRSFFRKDLPETGDARRAMIIGEYTCEVRHEETHIWIKNTATS